MYDILRSIFSSMLPTELLANITGLIWTLSPAGIVPTLNVVVPALISGITVDCCTVFEEVLPLLLVVGIKLLLSI